MSETPVLTKKQQKSSLSAKKTKTKETIRSVLASPYAKYWPLVSQDDCKQLSNILNQFLPELVKEKIKIPWKDLKNIPRSERKKFREAYCREQLSNKQSKVEDREGLVIGINDVTKSLENHTAMSVLITADILPRFMVEHLIDQAVLLKIPVLVVPHLRSILKDKCRISSVALAFTNCDKYRLVLDAIKETFKNYPVPKNHINYDRSFDAAFVSLNDNNKSISSGKNLNDNAIGKKSHKQIYLIRTSKEKRVFVPEKSCNETKNTNRMDVVSADFLSFSAESNVQNEAEKNYKSLKIKRIKGNANRNKRKIEAIKQKDNSKRGKKRFRKDST